MLLKIFSQPMCHACPPAKELGEKLAKQGLVQVKYFDVSESDGLAQAQIYNIMSTPSLVLLDKEKVVKTWVGTPDKEEIIKYLK